ncbi:MAG TPA: GDYXXLXY domain-containing protein [Acidiferrobacterales bacterium]|nr:GDYXXLXY domain-containing protein [Acidiferrobacterales bacterium]
MRKGVVILAGLIILALANYSIYSRERLLTEGNVVLLQLAPVDPRSLMQGDYMALRFQVANDIRSHVPAESPRDGYVVLTLDGRRIGTFSRVDGGTPLAANEAKMRYRMRDKQIKFATNAFFFQEGDAQLYNKARYGDFRVGGDGESILTGMRDEQLSLLGPPPRN